MIDDVTTTIRAPKALLERLDALTRMDGGLRTRSEAIRWALARGVEALEAERGVFTAPPPDTDLVDEVTRLRARVDALERRGG